MRNNSIQYLTTQNSMDRTLKKRIFAPHHPTKVTVLLLICDEVHNAMTSQQMRIAWLYCTHVFMSLSYVHSRSRK